MSKIPYEFYFGLSQALCRTLSAQSISELDPDFKDTLTELRSTQDEQRASDLAATPREEAFALLGFLIAHQAPKGELLEVPLTGVSNDAWVRAIVNASMSRAQHSASVRLTDWRTSDGLRKELAEHLRCALILFAETAHQAGVNRQARVPDPNTGLPPGYRMTDVLQVHAAMIPMQGNPTEGLSDVEKDAILVEAFRRLRAEDIREATIFFSRAALRLPKSPSRPEDLRALAGIIARAYTAP